MTASDQENSEGSEAEHTESKLEAILPPELPIGASLRLKRSSPGAVEFTPLAHQSHRGGAECR